MVRIQFLAKCVSVLLLLACSERLRSDDPHRGESREREAFFDAMREFLPHKELFDLVEHASVRKEIKLSDADAERIDKNVSKSFETMHAIRKANEGKQVKPEELKRQIREALDPLNEASYAILAQADFKRLLGIYVQARSYRALLNDQVAGHIGLEGQELEHFRQTRSESWQTIMEDMREAMKRVIRNAPPNVAPPREAFSKLFSQAEENLDLKLSQQLTPKQKDELEALKGVKFDLPKHPFNFGPSRGSSRGRSSSPGPGEKTPGEKTPGEKTPGEKTPGSKSNSESESRDCKSEDLKSSAHRRDEVVALPRPRI